MAKTTKTNLGFLLLKAEVKGVSEKGLLRSRNIGQVDLIWPRTGGLGLERGKVDACGVPLHFRCPVEEFHCSSCVDKQPVHKPLFVRWCA